MSRNPDAIRIIIVERLVLLREALTSLLTNMGGISVVAGIGVPADLMPAVCTHSPDVVVLQFDPAIDGALALLQELEAVSERARTLVVTPSADAAVHARAIELGAMGVLSCDAGAEILLKAIRKVHLGELWLDRTRAAGVVTRLARGHGHKDPETMRLESLTRREREIVMLVAEGLRNKDVAERLFISEATARNHLTSILDKLELTDRFQLAVYAFRRGLVTCPAAPAAIRMSLGWK